MTETKQSFDIDIMKNDIQEYLANNNIKHHDFKNNEFASDCELCPCGMSCADSCSQGCSTGCSSGFCHSGSK